LSKREADIAIRTLPKEAAPPEHLIGLQLVPVVLANYVCRAQADRLDPELVGNETRWISVEPRRYQEEMIAGCSYPDVPAWGAFSSLELLVQAACEGLGVVMLPTYVGDPLPALRRLAQPDLRHMADLWLLSHPDLRNNARLKATRAQVAQAIKAQASVFRGEG
jgi:DNA-binding transcriptional LysR family regulator